MALLTATVTFRIMPIVDFDGEYTIVASDGSQPTIETPRPHLTRCIVAVFQDGTALPVLQQTYTSDAGYESAGLTANLTMAIGQTYSIVVYMDNNKDYVDVTNLKEITIGKDGYILDGDPQIFSSDRFDITVTGNMSKDVSVLKRYCRISFIDTNPTSKIGDKVYHVSGFIPSGFNAYTGKPNDAFAGVYFTNTSVAMLATSNQSISFTISVYSSEGKPVKDQNVSNVPANRNYWTKVYWSSAARKSVDLTALPGWSGLVAGTHAVTVVAKADGYRDSEPSEAVMVTKESTVYNLTLPDMTGGPGEVISPSGMTLYTTNNNANIIQVSEKTYNAVTSFNDPEVPSSIPQFASAYNVVLPDTFESLTRVGYRVTFADGTPIEEQPIELRIETMLGLEAVTVLRLNWKTDELEVFDITVDNSKPGGKITINTSSDYLLAFCLKNEDPLATTDCITFTGESSDFTLAVGSDGAKEWDGTVEYSTDHENWTEWDGSAVSSVDKKLYLRGSGNTTFFTDLGARLSLSARAACSGNIQTLLEYSNPPTTLADYCYAYMFSGCTSLTQAPELPATTLFASCYAYMFYGCTSLTQAPELPATTLAEDCYAYMFNSCSSLKISTTQSSEYPTAWRIPASGTISSTATSWSSGMLLGTGGTFTSNPSINTTYYGAWEGSSTQDPLAGTWVFNKILQTDSEFVNLEFSFNFTAIIPNIGNGQLSFVGLSREYTDSAFNVDSLFYRRQDTSTVEVYNGHMWGSDVPRTINVTSVLSEVENGDALLTWLQANATKQASDKTLISFTIAGTQYQAKEGMTWAEWVESDYNTDGYILFTDGRVVSSGYDSEVHNVIGTDTIIDDHSYSVTAFTGGSGK